MSFGDAAIGVFSASTGGSERLDRSELLAVCSGARTAPAVTRSATEVAAVTCSCIVLVLELTAAPPVGCESAIFARVKSELAAALPAGSSRASNERSESGMRKILKPAISGNASAASGDTKVKTAAGTSPPIKRLIAFV